MQSLLGRNPRKLHTPLESAAIMAARCEMLLSPGTVISASIRGARFMRNSIDPSKAKAMLQAVSGIQHRPQLPLRDKEYFVCERILNFGAGRKPTHVHQALIRSIRTFHKSRLSRHRRAVGIVALGRLRWRIATRGRSRGGRGR